MLYEVNTDIKWNLSEKYLAQNLAYYGLSYAYNNKV